jgi:hypothetical protein
MAIFDKTRQALARLEAVIAEAENREAKLWSQPNPLHEPLPCKEGLRNS